MKPIYLAAVHRTLDLRLPEVFPEFAPMTLKLSRAERERATLFPGSRLSSCLLPIGRTFMHFIPHRRQERLLAEVGWSETGRFPIELSSHGSLRNPVNEFEQSEWLIDLAELYHRKHNAPHLGWDVWKCSVSIEHPDFMKIFMKEDLEPVSDSEATVRAEAAVSACFATLKDVAIPYLAQWVQLRSERVANVL